MILVWQILKSMVLVPQMRAIIKGVGATGIAAVMVATSSNMIISEMDKRDKAANAKIDKLDEKTFTALREINQSVKNTESRIWEIAREIRYRNGVTGQGGGMRMPQGRDSGVDEAFYGGYAVVPGELKNTN